MIDGYEAYQNPSEGYSTITSEDDDKCPQIHHAYSGKKNSKACLIHIHNDERNSKTIAYYLHLKYKYPLIDIKMEASNKSRKLIRASSESHTVI